RSSFRGFPNQETRTSHAIICEFSCGILLIFLGILSFFLGVLRPVATPPAPANYKKDVAPRTSTPLDIPFIHTLPPQEAKIQIQESKATIPRAKRVLILCW